MATSVTFDLVTTLVSTFDTALSGVVVYDGYGQSDDPTDYLMVGVEDPDSDGRAPSVDARQEWGALGNRTRNEEGTVTCVAVSWNGDPNGLGAARTAVKATTAAVEDALREDPSLAGAVPGLMWVGYGTRTQLIQLQATDGVCVMCVFEIAFKARLNT